MATLECFFHFGAIFWAHVIFVYSPNKQGQILADFTITKKNTPYYLVLYLTKDRAAAGGNSLSLYFFLLLKCFISESSDYSKSFGIRSL